MAVLSKSQMSEEDIKFHYITPAFTAKWDKQHITLETKITDGRINLKGNIVAREKPKRADYVLYLSANNPIAIVEAKDNNHTVSHGLQQAMTYAQMLENIKYILEEAGLTMDDIVKTTVFLQDMSLFAGMNGVYVTYFDRTFPARSAIAVKALPKNALVEIECIAIR